MVEVLDLCLWTMSTALDGKDGCGEGAPITLTTMDALTMMMLEFNVHQVTLGHFGEITFVPYLGGLPYFSYTMHK